MQIMAGIYADLPIQRLTNLKCSPVTTFLKTKINKYPSIYRNTVCIIAIYLAMLNENKKIISRHVALNRMLKCSCDRYRNLKMSYSAVFYFSRFLKYLKSKGKEFKTSKVILV